MFRFTDQGTMVIVTYQPDDSDPFDSFSKGAGTLTSPFGADFLLDLRGLTGPLDILSNEALGRRWAELARGRDVGRRTAIVTTDAGVAGQLDTFRAIYPYRKISVFADLEAAKVWLASIADNDSDDVQLI